MNLIEKLDQLEKTFQHLKTPQEKYTYIISQSKLNNTFPQQHQLDENLIKGCISQLWLVPNMLPEGRIEFVGFSEAMIVNGIVKILK